MNNNPTLNLPNGNAPADPPKRPPPSKAALAAARKRRAANPLAPRRPPRPVQKKRPIEVLPRDADGLQLLTGVTSGPSVPKMNSTRNEKELEEFAKQRAANNGWGSPIPADATSVGTFPVFTTKRALKEAMHFHIMKLTKASQTGVKHDLDPTNQGQFTRPVSLHRRDARQPPPGRAVKPEEEDDVVPEDEAEAAKQAQIKEEKEAQKAIDRAQIAPSLKKDGTKPVAKKDKPFINGGVKSSKLDPALQEVRYAEALPWHLEDADGKNVWVGTYVQALSNTHVAFVVQGSGFTMIPLDKYYTFKSKPTFNAYTIEEAESILGKKAAPTRWAMRDEDRKMAEAEKKFTRQILGGRPRVKGESATSRGRNASERFAREELDLEGDGDFSDDDEAPALEPDFDEDAKETRDRMRKNHLNANLFGNTDEKDVERQEALENKEDQAKTEHGRHLRKALIKLEGHGDYLEDDDEFDDTSSEEEEVKKDEEKPDESKDKTDGDITMSGTAAASKPKTADKKGKSLKRPGSPNLSESSGNESSRKKKLKQDPAASLRASRAGTPSLSRKAGGATSDGEGTAGEMSDSGPKRKIKTSLMTGTNPRGTPSGSRAASPAPSAARAASPGSPLGSPAKGGAVVPDIVTADEIRAEMLSFKAQGTEGVSIGVLMRKFITRVNGPGQLTKKEWITLVRKVCRFDNDDKLMYLK